VCLVQPVRGCSGKALLDLICRRLTAAQLDNPRRSIDALDLQRFMKAPQCINLMAHLLPGHQSAFAFPAFDQPIPMELLSANRR
jgi:hypothetical protein